MIGNMADWALFLRAKKGCQMLAQKSVIISMIPMKQFEKTLRRSKITLKLLLSLEVSPISSAECIFNRQDSSKDRPTFCQDP